MSLDALVWLLVGIGLGVAACLLLLMLVSALEWFRLGQRLKRARHVRLAAVPRDADVPAKVVQVEMPPGSRDVLMAEADAPVARATVEASERRPRPVDAKSMVVAPPKSRAIALSAARMRLATTAPRIAEKALADTPKPVPKASSAPSKPPAKPTVVASADAKPAGERTAASAKPAPASPEKVVAPVAKGVTSSPAAPPPAIAANDPAPKPKLTVVASNKPATPVQKARSFVAPEEKKPVPEPKAADARPAEARPTEVKAVEAPAPLPVQNVKALFGEAFTVDKLTVPGALPLPDKADPDHK